MLTPKRNNSFAENNDADANDSTPGAQPTLPVAQSEHKLTIVYELREEVPGGALNHEVLQAILAWEERLRSLPEWRATCGATPETHRHLCDPGISAARHLMPSPQWADTADVVPKGLALDGGGAPVSLRMARILLGSRGLEELILPEDSGGEAAGEESTPMLLRSGFSFICTGSQWRWLFGALAPFLGQPAVVEGAMPGEKRQFFRVWYDGTDMEKLDTEQAMRDDIWKVGIAMVLVLMYSAFHTRSLVLCFASPIAAFLATPLTHAVCAVITGSSEVTMVVILSPFFAIGLGADIAFVYFDLWVNSASNEKLESLTDRVLWTYTAGVKASFAAAATTAVSFLANLTSAIRVLRQGVLFTGICMLNVWLCTTLFFVPLLVVNEHACSCLRLCRGCCLSSPWSIWVRHLCRKRWLYLLGTVAMLSIGGAMSASMFEINFKKDVWPKWHNQMSGKEACRHFAGRGGVLSSFSTLPAVEPICKGASIEATWSQREDCALSWCEAEMRSPSDSLGACTARVRQAEDVVGSCSSAEHVNVTAHFYGSWIFEEVVSTIKGIASSHVGVESSSIVVDSYSAGFLHGTPSQIISSWESGMVEAHRIVALAAGITIPISDTASLGEGRGTCRLEVVTFCGEVQCQLDGSWASQEVELRNASSSSPYASPSSSLGPHRVGSPLAMGVVATGIVQVVFGLWLPRKIGFLDFGDPSKKWFYLEDASWSQFSIRDPWTQRDLYRFCRSIPPKLNVVSYNCWMEQFRAYAREARGSFPVPAEVFQDVAADFMDASNQSATGIFWDTGVKAVSFSFEVTRPRGDEVLIFKQDWDRHLQAWNETAKPCAQGVDHVSSMWSSAERMNAIVSGVVNTLISMLVLAFLGVLCSTWSLALSFFVAAATLCAMIGVVVTLVCVLRVQLGVMEFLSMSLFLGYAITFSLHVAQKYSADAGLIQPDPTDSTFANSLPSEQAAKRYLRSVYSLKLIGTAITGSSLTTALSMSPLLWCTFAALAGVGKIGIVVSFTSLISALVPLPAALMCVGPTRFGVCPRRSRPGPQTASATPDCQAIRE